MAASHTTTAHQQASQFQSLMASGSIVEGHLLRGIVPVQNALRDDVCKTQPKDADHLSARTQMILERAVAAFAMEHHAWHRYELSGKS